MDYCDLCYMCTKEENLKKLQQIQNCACRIILRADNTTSTNILHRELSLPPLQQRRKIHMAMECHNNVYNNEAGLHKFFTQIDTNRVRSTRSENTKRVKVANVRSVVGRKAFSFRGPDFWNSVESDIRLIENKNGFKKHISKLIVRDVNHPG